MSAQYKIRARRISFFFAFFCLWLFMSCNHPQLEENRLLGKTKAEILEIVFTETPKNKYGEVKIATFGVRGNMEFHYFTSQKEALQDNTLMSSYDAWGIDFIKMHSFSIFANENYLLLTFKDGRVMNCQRNIFSHE